MQVEVPFVDLARGTGDLRNEIDQAIGRVMDRGRFILGEEVEGFEREFAQATGARAAVGVASGTDALELSLRALGIGPGDKVVTQANTCIPTVSAIERAGAQPVLCDVDPETAAMDPASLSATLGSRTRAVILVHLYGQCGPIRDVCEVAGAAGVDVIEDCAQAHLAAVDGRLAGTIGALGAFSFYPTKNLGAFGDSGAILCGSEEMEQRLRALRVYGAPGRGDVSNPGVNSRLDEIQAAVLRVKLRHLERWNRRRAAIAAIYDAALADASVRPLKRLPGTEHAFHLYVVRASSRDAFRSALRQAGVETGVHYAQAVHNHPGYANLVCQAIPLVNAERLAAEVVSLPMGPHLSDAEVEYVASAAAEAATQSQ